MKGEKQMDEPKTRVHLLTTRKQLGKTLIGTSVRKRSVSYKRVL